MIRRRLCTGDGVGDTAAFILAFDLDVGNLI